MPSSFEQTPEPIDRYHAQSTFFLRFPPCRPPCDGRLRRAVPGLFGIAVAPSAEGGYAPYIAVEELAGIAPEVAVATKWDAPEQRMFSR